MKHTLSILPLLLLLLFIQGCYEDLGNYDYKDINEIECEGIEESYTVQQLDKLNIVPEISQLVASDESDLTFLWYMYPDGRGDQADTLSFERNLDVAVGSVPGLYKAIYKITDSTTGIFHKFEFEVMVITPLSSGLVVLSEINNVANVALLNAAGKLYEDVYTTVNGETAGSNPLCLGFVDNIYDKQIIILCNDEYGGKLTDPIFLRQMGTYDDLFWVSFESPKPVIYASAENSLSNGDDYVIDNGLLYTRDFMGPPPVFFSNPALRESDFFPLKIDAGSYREVFYDNLSKAFYVFYQRSTVLVDEIDETEEDFLFNPADMGMTMIHGGDGFKGDGYGLFFNEEDNSYYSVQLSFGHETRETSKIIPLNIVKVGDADLGSASSIALSRLSPQYFYAVGNELYCLDAIGGTASLVYSFEEGIIIDYIEFEPRESDRLMYIGTRSSSATNEKNGSFHFMDVALNGTVTLRDSYSNIAGRIVDFMYKEVL